MVQTPPLLYTQNRDPNFGFFSYPSGEKLCFNGPKRSTRQIFDSLKIDQVINVEVPQDLPLPNRAYLGRLSLPSMAYLIKHMAHKLDGVCNCQTSLPVLYPSHPYKHPSIVSSNAPISNWKAHQEISTWSVPIWKAFYRSLTVFTA